MQVRSNTTAQIASEYATRTWELMSRIATCCAEKELITRVRYEEAYLYRHSQLRYTAIGRSQLNCAQGSAALSEPPNMSSGAVLHLSGCDERTTTRLGNILNLKCHGM